MTDLIDEIRESFDKAQIGGRPKEHEGPVMIMGNDNDAEMPPGFHAMRNRYGRRLTTIVRRGYRHFSGAALPTNADQLIELTSPVLIPMLMDLLVKVFCDGVRIGHQDDQMVKMSIHYEQLDELFDNQDFIESSAQMAQGFTKDAEIAQYFLEYLNGGMDYFSHLTGFAHEEVNPDKMWDLWLLLGGATTCSCYLAGHLLGSTWHERDVLDGIEIASEDPHESD